MSKFLYAPSHTTSEYTKHVREHVDHLWYGDISNGRGAHKNQLFTVVDCEGDKFALTNEYLGQPAWLPMSELWAYSTPQCMTCK